MAYGVAIVAGLVFVAVALRAADLRLRADAIHQVRLLARSIDLDEVGRLTGTSVDLSSPYYGRLKERLAVLRSSLPRCRFLYLLGQRSSGELFFFGDSEPIGSKDESPAGEIYDDHGEFAHAFEERTEFTSGPIRDRWGTWMSAFVLLSNPLPGVPLVTLGLDIDAFEWWRQVGRASLIPLGLSFLLLVVLALGRILLARRDRRGLGPRSHYGEATWVATVGAVLTLAAAWMAHNRAWTGYREAFSQLADAQFGRTVSTFNTLCSHELEGLIRYFEGSVDVEADEFHGFAQYLVKNPAIQAWEWFPAVNSNEVSAFQARMRASGKPDYTVWQKDAAGKRVEVSGRPVYFPIAYAEPIQGNERALGYDPSSNPLLNVALEASRRSGLPRITQPVKLVQEIGDQKGAVVYQAVFSPGEPRRLRGYVGAVLRLGTFVNRTTDVQNPDHPNFAMDLFQIEPGSPPLMLASTSRNQPVGDYAETRYFYVFGKLFCMRLTPQHAFAVTHPRREAWLVAVVGFGLSLLVAALVGMVVRQRRDLELLVDRRTQALRDSEETFRRLFSNNPVPMALSTIDERKIVDVNGAFLDTLGYSRDEIIGRNIVEMGLFADSAQQLAAVDQLKKQGHVSSLELRVRHANGSLVEGLFSGEVVQYQDSAHFLTAMIDITPLKKAEAERLRLVTAIEQASETVVVTDANGVIQYANPAFAAITGYTCEEVIGKTTSILKSGTHDSTFYRDLWKTIKSGKTWNGRFVNRRKDGALYTEEVAISPVRDSAGAIANYVAVKRDITNELKLERQYMQAQKMELVGRLAGGVAHDFNNMLGVILGYTEMALSKVDPGQPLHADLEEIRASAWRTADLTRQLLAFARKQTVLPKILDLNEAVSSSARMLGRLIGENIRLTWKPGEGLWPVRIDPSQIDQILTNLAVNARDAIGGVGGITIATGNVTLDHAYCAEHEGAYPGEYVMLFFSDTGCGMAPDVLAHIFEPFYTTKGVGEGSGLGLSTVYGIVKQNHGFISAESKLGQGAQFKIYLPRQVGTSATSTAETKVVKAVGGKETLMLVEDDHAVLAMTKQMLVTLGYTVLSASNPHEAIRIVRECEGDIHLLIVDVVMPEMSGPELVRQITLFRPALKSLFVSSYPPNVVSTHGVQDWGNFIQKPFSVTALATMIHKILQRG